MRIFAPLTLGGFLLIPFLLWEGLPGQEQPRRPVQSYLHEPELDPDEHDLYLDEYAPVPMLRVPDPEVTAPLLPVFDLRPVRLEDWNRDSDPLELLEATGVRKAALLAPIDSFAGEGTDGPAPTHLPEDRTLRFLDLNLDGIDEPDFADRLSDLIRRAAAGGFAGVYVSSRLGLFLRDSGGSRVPVDDERLVPLWKTCGKAGLTVLIHTAAPTAFFDPVDRHNELYDLFRREPSLSLHGRGIPPKEDLLEERDRMIRRNPETVFIAARFGEEAENLASLADRLESLPNLHVELSERIAELGRQPYASRRFFLEFADRILFGAGVGVEPHPTYYRFLQTDSEFFEYNSERRLPYGHWRLYGIFLPQEVLQAIYHDNARRLFGREP